jgi:tetratricopeptide (TPR) repeat protein
MNNNDLLPKGEDIVEQARRYADEELWDEAIETYKKALVGNPTDADLYNDLGIAFDEAGKLTEAEQAYQKATELDPQFSAAFYNLGLMYEEQSRFPEAVEAYQKCIKYSKNPTEHSAAREKLIAMTSEPKDKNNTTSRSCSGMLGLLVVRVILGIIGAFLTMMLSLKLIPIQRNSDYLPSALLSFAMMMSIFAAIDYLTSRFIGRPLKLSLALRSVGCFIIVFIPTLACALLSSVVAITRKPFVLPQRDITSFYVHYDQKGKVMMGADLYLVERLREEAGYDTCPASAPGNWVVFSVGHGLGAVEFALFNNSENPIEITPVDFALTYNGQSKIEDNTNIQPIQVVEYKEAQQYLRSFEDLWVSGAMDFEFVLFSPLELATGPSDYIQTKRMQSSLEKNAFKYGQIAPSQTRHGFVYFFVGACGSDFDALRSPEDWELKVMIHHSSGEVSQYLFTFNR